ncbi:hypothetical protein [Arenimonas caeni]|uniref:hypothetical protein n=1 Tax=Arenimonas caeni TaxID=2058085 RepID=UPI0013B068F0|nr:hypothetical protein [Arenimonas caeni]
MDIADLRHRQAIHALREMQVNRYRGEWLGDVCGFESTNAPEIYVLSRTSIPIGGQMRAARVTIRLERGGEVTHELMESPFDWEVTSTTKNALDASSAEAFRTMLLEGNFPQMASDQDPGFCDGDTDTLESCVRGRYFGIIRRCEQAGDTPLLRPLADAIEAFALGEQTIRR